MKMKVLIAVLNWGLGHATRSSAIIEQRLLAGDEVVLAGDGNSLRWLTKRYPTLRHIKLPELNIHYAAKGSQVKTIIKQMPHIIKWLRQDHKTLQKILAEEHFDLVISDNRFTFYSERVKCIYITHQLNVITEIGLKSSVETYKPSFASRIATAIHLWFIKHYDECWIPDYAVAPSLAGYLSHIQGGINEWNTRSERTLLKYIGPLSRFGQKPENRSQESGVRSQESGVTSQESGTKICRDATYHVHSTSHEPVSTAEYIAILSGPEPQRTELEEQLLTKWRGKNYVIVRGLPCDTDTHGNGRLLNNADDETIAYLLTHAKHIVCRSGYSTLMDLQALGLLDNNDIDIQLIPTPGQPEQEYIALLHSRH